MVDLPTFVETRMIAAARTPHKCGECRAEIIHGAPYRRDSGVWDGKWEVYKMCMWCHSLTESLMANLPMFDQEFEYGNVIWEAEEMEIYCIFPPVIDPYEEIA